MHILDIHRPQDREKAGHILQEMIAGRRDSCPLPLRSKSGLVFPVETRFWFGKWGERDCLFGVSKDLSQQQTTLDLFQAIFQHNPSPMSITRAEGDRRVFTDVNAALLDTLGYTRDEVIGKTSNEVCLVAFPEDLNARIHECITKDGLIANLPIKARTKSGIIINGLLSGVPIHTQAGLLFLTVTVDITQQKQTEAMFAESVRQLQTILASIQTGVVVVDAQNPLHS